MPINFHSLVPDFYRHHLETIDSTLKKAGYECYLVGGSVRDLVMNKIPKEYDFTTNAEPKQVKKLFRTVIDTGIDHGTVTIVLDKVNYEVTTYRIDKDYHDGRRPEHVEFGTTLEEDLKRRDFTMNALAFDIQTGRLVDEHFGLKDIENKMIRTIGNPIKRFSEDGLRPIRALRFASTLNFTIETETKKAIQETKSITQKVSLERFQDEILKSFLGDNPAKMIQLLVEENIFPLFVPNLSNSISINLNKINSLNQVSNDLVGMQLAFAFDSLISDLTPKNLESILRSLKFSGQNIKDSLLFLELMNKWYSIGNKNSLSFYQIKKELLAPVKRHFQQRLVIDKSFLNKLFPIFGTHTDTLIQVWEEKHPLLLSDLAVNGNDLAKNFPEFPKTNFGELLNYLLDLVLESPKENEFQRLIIHSAEFINKLSK
ncbi:CCA tRNA nucleotidyltransferase [Leptospira jelokensis]|uniref:CCA tRNA nucleotidyltransferase n=1 Tax=Leptospira jelokensis TaxID=2484931 RepID=A0A4Z1A2V9_9LEPT|nr:CCA tRNA nucleotidyltransferase [Leptospira jelokensis]TGL72868.1 CCA tRNA nucleotidyltransferase [Leptospira jelokensis]